MDDLTHRHPKTHAKKDWGWVAGMAATWRRGLQRAS
jgi:hypothetical protein